MDHPTSNKIMTHTSLEPFFTHEIFQITKKKIYDTYIRAHSTKQGEKENRIKNFSEGGERFLVKY